MIAFEERVHDQLPVGGNIVGVARKQVQFPHGKSVKVFAEGADVAEIAGAAG